MTKVFIMIKGEEQTRPFFDAFTIKFCSAIGRKGVDYRIYKFNNAYPESNNDVDEKISSYRPNLVMVINQTVASYTETINSIGWSSGGAYTGGTFNVKLFQPNVKDPVWDANLEAYASLGLEMSAKKASEKLVKKLIEDQVLK